MQATEDKYKASLESAALHHLHELFVNDYERFSGEFPILSAGYNPDLMDNARVDIATIERRILQLLQLRVGKKCGASDIQEERRPGRYTRSAALLA